MTEQCKKLKKKKGVSLRGNVALLSHILPLLLTKQRGVSEDNPLGMWGIKNKGKREKEERERG